MYYVLWCIMYYDVLCIMMYYVLWCIIYYILYIIFYILYIIYYSFYHIDIGQHQTQFLNVWHMSFGCQDHSEIWASGTVKTEVFSLSTPQQKSLTCQSTRWPVPNSLKHARFHSFHFFKGYPFFSWRVAVFPNFRQEDSWSFLRSWLQPMPLGEGKHAEVLAYNKNNLKTDIQRYAITFQH